MPGICERDAAVYNFSDLSSPNSANGDISKVFVAANQLDWPERGL